MRGFTVNCLVFSSHVNRYFCNIFRHYKGRGYDLSTGLVTNHYFVPKIYIRWFKIRSWWHKSEISVRLWIDYEFSDQTVVQSICKDNPFQFSKDDTTPNSEYLAQRNVPIKICTVVSQPLFLTSPVSSDTQNTLIPPLLFQPECTWKKGERMVWLTGRQLQHSGW